jgi:hypothetical protein
MLASKGKTVMKSNPSDLSTKKFSALTGIPAAQIARWLREGRLLGAKKSGRWYIPHDQLQAPCILHRQKSTKPSAKPGTTAQTATDSKDTHAHYSVEGFAQMTYLTEWGVRDWLKKGMLSGQKNDKGEWRIGAENLASPSIKRLLR